MARNYMDMIGGGRPSCEAAVVSVVGVRAIAGVESYVTRPLLQSIRGRALPSQASPSQASDKKRNAEHSGGLTLENSAVLFYADSNLLAI
jgi:hypothetical protein